MFLFWLLWLTIVIGGFYLGIGYGVQMYQSGFDLSFLLNTIIYCGCAIFALPKLIKLAVKK
jgi:predicted branched-subunit amino acid permease